MFLRFTGAFALLSLLVPALAAAKPYLSSGDHSRLVNRLTCKVTDADPTVKIKPRKVVYGHSKKKKPLVAWIVEPAKENRDEAQNVYLIGAQHGDERTTSRALDYFVRELKLVSDDYRNERRIIVIPLYNPDGYKRNDRFANERIDLNRDFPSSDGAEGAPNAKETQAFMRLMEKYPANLIYNLHQPFRVVLYYPEHEEIAKPFGLLSDYPLGSDVGYPTPGSLGTWAREQKIPIITVELSRSMKKAMAPFIYEEIRLALFHASFGCIPRSARNSQLERYLAE
ncbi:MAG: succinylglutamate desuccinylase/aspartoacylase family protein [Spirochaetes bacterium]|nr:succinylglutamate desuccinylase/aspartoacylase family protein [Spirochaetota bacterium]